MKTFNVFKLENTITGSVYYCKGISNQVPDETRFLNKMFGMAEKHVSPGNMLRDILVSEYMDWKVSIKAKEVFKELANDIKRQLIAEDKACDSVFMTK
jgi:hypothetical protein